MITRVLVGTLIPCLLVTPAPLYGEQQLEQETISIHGNRGLPKTVYIAPWKRLGKPLEGEHWQSTIKDPLEPLEQDLFLRRLELYRRGPDAR